MSTTRNLATVPSTELSNAVNLLAEVNGEIVRLPYSLIDEKLVPLEEHMDNENNPHKLDADDVGAATAQEVEELKTEFSEYKISNDAELAKQKSNLKDFQDARTIKTYTGLTQLGLVDGKETITKLIEILPEHSKLVYTVGTSHNVSEYPSSYGILKIHKTHHSRVTLDFNEHSTSNSIRYIGYGSYSNSEVKWSGWAKLYSEHNKPTASDVGAVPTTRKINNKILSSDITLSASDVGARPNTWMPTAEQVGALPNIGGTLGGDLTLENENGKVGAVGGSYAYISHIPNGDETNQIELIISALPTDLTKYVQFAKRTNGVDKWYRLYGEHNKTRGSYTGNSSTTERSIKTNGTGNFAIIWSSDTGNVVLVTRKGAFIGTPEGVTFLRNNALISDGVIYLKTDHQTLNKSGYTYNYELY